MHSFGHRSRLAASYGTPRERCDRLDLRETAGLEHLVCAMQVVRGKGSLYAWNLRLDTKSQHGLARYSVENRAQRRRLNHVPRDYEQVGRVAFRDETINIEQYRSIGPGVSRLEICQYVIQVVAGFRLAVDTLRRDSAGRADNRR